MPNIVTCYKWVVDEADVKVDAKTGQLQFERVGYKISDYDRNAIEAAVQLQEQHGGTITAVTVGPKDAKASLKDALSRGPEKTVFVGDPLFAGADAYLTSVALAAAIRKLDAFDIILCGEGSSDVYAQQVGPRLGQLLGIPVITFVTKIEVSGNKVISERKLPEGIEVVEAGFPVLLTVLPDINKPRIPSVKQILAASKKPVTEMTAADLGVDAAKLTPRMKVLASKGATMERKQIRITGDDLPAIAKNLAEAILKEGVLS